MYVVGRERYVNFCEYYKLYGFILRVYDNKGRLLKNTCIFEVILEVSKFISNYVEEYVFVLFGRVLGFKRIDVRFLFFYMLKVFVWRVYLIVMEV